MRVRKFVVAAAVVSGVVTFTSGTANAGHDHFIVTPNGNCHQVAQGQTARTDPAHGGHKFHDHVHLGATGGTSGAPFQLGDGHSQVVVFRDDCFAP